MVPVVTIESNGAYSILCSAYGLIVACFEDGQIIASHLNRKN